MFLLNGNNLLEARSRLGEPIDFQAVDNNILIEDLSSIIVR